MYQFGFVADKKDKIFRILIHQNVLDSNRPKMHSETISTLRDTYIHCAAWHTVIMITWNHNQMGSIVSVLFIYCLLNFIIILYNLEILIKFITCLENSKYCIGKWTGVLCIIKMIIINEFSRNSIRFYIRLTKISSFGTIKHSILSK